MAHYCTNPVQSCINVNTGQQNSQRFQDVTVGTFLAQLLLFQRLSINQGAGFDLILQTEDTQADPLVLKHPMEENRCQRTL